MGQDFNAADKGIKISKSGSRADLQQINSPKTNQGKNELFKKGGDTMAKSDMKEDTKTDKAQDKAMISKAFKQHDAQEHKGGKGTNLKLAKGGKAKRYGEGGDVTDEQEDDTSALTAYTPPKVMPSRPVSKTPTATKPAAKPAPNYSNEGRYKAPKSSSPADVTKMSVSDRIKASRSQSREGTTDTRSVGERLRSAFGMAKGGMAGSFRSSANGIAQRGKTRGKMR